jgi:hypothetical protein
MRRGIAIILAILFSSLLILPAFGGSAESGLRSCCKKNGRHHCFMGKTGSLGSATSIEAVSAKCSYFSQSYLAAHVEIFTPIIDRAGHINIVRQSLVMTQMAMGYRLFQHRSNHKRGPPPSLLS